MIDTRAPVYVDGDLVVYRGSKLGLCFRALTAARLGMPGVPPSAKHQADMEAGQSYEAVVYAKVGAMGFDVSRVQDEVELPAAEGCVIRAHLDAVVTRITRRGTLTNVCEVKALAPSTFRKWRSQGFLNFPGWAWQLAVAMHATGLPGLMVVADRSTGILSLSDVLEPPVSMLLLEERVARVEELAVTGELAPCPEAFPCPWFYLHRGPALTPAATPEHVRGILREAHERAVGPLRERVALRLAEVGEA